MKNIVNRDITPWERPWNITKFDDLYNRDDRYFAVLIKGVLSWLNRNIVMYNKPINHFIFNTGSSYLYVESNGYEFNLNETTGEDYMYMQMPRCVIEISSISFPTAELTNPYSRGFYERRDGNNIRGFNAEIRRLPIELTLNLKYVFSNFNESIIVLQEIIDKLIFQQYFNITYLGEIIKCSIEFPQDMKPEINKIDMSSNEVIQKNLIFDIKICSNYPIINTRSEIPTDSIIQTFSGVIAGENSLGKIIINDNTSNNSSDDNSSDDNSSDNNNSDDNSSNNNNNNDPNNSYEPSDNIIDNKIQEVQNKIDRIIDVINKGGYQSDLDENLDNVIDEKDLDILKEKLEELTNISYEYDKITNKIYVYYKNGINDDIIIDVESYKFNNH